MAENNVIAAVYGQLKCCAVNGHRHTSYQYDYGQKLEFIGFPEGMIPDAFEVHFDIGNGATVTMIGQRESEDGKDRWMVDIPDQCLLKAAPIRCWLYLHTGEADGETRYEVGIPVRPRAAVTHEEPTPVQQSEITQAIAALNSAVEQTAADVTEVSGLKDQVEQAATDAKAAKTAAEAAQGIAEQAQESAELAAESAAESLASVTEMKNHVDEVDAGIDAKADGAIQDIEIAKENALSAVGSRQETAVAAVNSAKVSALSDMSAFRDATEDARDITIEQSDIAAAAALRAEASAESAEESAALAAQTAAEFEQDVSDLSSNKADKTDTVLETTLSRGRKADTTVGFGSFAFGDNVEASGAFSHAEGGFNTTASGHDAHAEGNRTTASGSHSHAEGYLTNAAGSASHAEGLGDNDKTKTHEITCIVGSNVSTVATIYGAIGNGAHSEGGHTTAYGGCSHAEGDYTTASVQGAHAEGYYTNAIATHAHAEGYYTTASGQSSHAEGNSSNATASYSHAEGTRTTASNANSHAEGSQTTASGPHSHAEGVNTTASENNAHAEGSNTIASEYSAHSEGTRSEASGLYSHAGGFNTRANGLAMRAIGFNNVPDTPYPAWTAGTEYEVGDRVTYAYGIGYRCIEANSDETFTGSKWARLARSTEEGTLLVVGNGSGDDIRSNAFRVDRSGDGRFGRDVYVGCNSDSTGGTKVATATEVAAKLDAPAVTGTSGQVLSLDENLQPVWSTPPDSVQDEIIQGKADKTNTVLETTLSRGRKAGTTIGPASFAFGYNVEASGGESFAEGTNTVASGNNAHAEGGGSVASGLDSHAQGWRTVANHRSQTVFGECNVEDPSTADSEARGTYVEIVGNGTAVNARSNARTLDWSGNEVLAGDLTVNAGNASEKTVGGLAREVSGLSDSLGNLGRAIENLDTAVGDKLDAPATAGTSGQVLTSDGQGGHSWEDPSGEDLGLSIVNGILNITYEEVGA